MKSNNNSDDLKIFFEKPTLRSGGICTVTMKNNAKPEWNVTIIEIGTKFFNRDGSNYIAGPYPVNIGTGGQTYTRSNDPQKCVFQTTTFIKVSIPGQGEAVYSNSSDVAPTGQCALEYEFILGPKSFILATDLESPSLSKMLELTDSSK
jgi:hypothetical protein